mmetsp:Transcript_836/g.2454  ORF Transcript_836/g.2454 Transcript_836/m.2454 type:complete len:523 (-) Transcript_836:89-1657(-)
MRQSAAILNVLSTLSLLAQVSGALLRQQGSRQLHAGSDRLLLPGITHDGALIDATGGGGGRRIQNVADDWMRQMLRMRHVKEGGFSGLQTQKWWGHTEWRISEIPDPTKDPEACGFSGPTFVCDPDGFLSPEGRAQVANATRVIEATTNAHCPDGSGHGYQMAVVIVDKMADADWVGWSELLTAERFATSLGESWGVGHHDCGNGVVLFAAIGDRYAYLKTAKSAHEMISEAEAVRIIDNMKPELKAENYDAAFLEGAQLVQSALQGQEVPEPGLSWSEFPWKAIIGITVMLCIWCWPLFVIPIVFCCAYALMPFAMLADCVQKRRRASEVEAAKEAAAKDLRIIQEELKRDEFDQKMCPICLEEFSLQDVAKGTEVTTNLDCGHRFHKACIDRWLRNQASNSTCPLCRATVDKSIVLADTDELQSEAHQNRLRFYLSQWQQRHSTVVQFSASGPIYRLDSTGYWMFYAHPGVLEPAGPLYVDTLSDVVTATTAGGFSGSGGGGFGGGGGFSGCGGGGGGGW